MLEKGISIIKLAFERTIGTGEYIIIYIISLIFVYIYMKSKTEKSLMVNYTIISILIIFNPIIAYILNKFLTSGVYWRLFWNVPLGITIAYCFTEFVFMSDTKWKKIIVTISLIFLIIYSGNLIYQEGVFQKVNNWSKLPDEDFIIINTISNEDVENKKLFAPPEIIPHVRQVDSSIQLAYNRDPSGNYGRYKFLQLFINNNYEEGVEALIEEECNFIVWNKSVNLSHIENVEFITETPNYYIYRINIDENDE